jgi:hypothetical protein
MEDQMKFVAHFNRVQDEQLELLAE